MNCVSVSIVCHRQLSLAILLISDLQSLCSDAIREVILTLNIEESFDLNEFNFSFPVRIIRNEFPLGFSANHNAAFNQAEGDFFCILNPDIRLTQNPFPPLLELARQSDVGVIAPRVFNSSGQREDSERRFPTPWELMKKIAGGKSAVWSDAHPVSSPDWIAGMFMLFPRSVFEELHGFDERYFLYYEDVDLCARLALAGYKRLVCSDVTVVHDARRSSHGNLRYAAMHLQSIFRFFFSDVYRQIRKL
ncbi:MAG: glycosyltransferase [Bacteroidales bacterium]